MLSVQLAGVLVVRDGTEPAVVGKIHNAATIFTVDRCLHLSYSVRHAPDGAEDDHDQAEPRG
jgi:hypothetical protein